MSGQIILINIITTNIHELGLIIYLKNASVSAHPFLCELIGTNLRHPAIPELLWPRK